MRLTDLRLSLHTESQRVSARLYNETKHQLLAQQDSKLVDVTTLQDKALNEPEKNPASAKALQNLGRQLAKMAMPGTISQALIAQLSLGHIRLWIDVSENRLLQIPWEYIWLDELGALAKHPLVLLLRGTPNKKLFRLHQATNTKFLVAFADPQTHPFGPLTFARAEFDSTINILTRSGFEVRQITRAHKKGFLEDVETFQPDVIHFIGHGIETPTGGGLVLESDKEPGYSVLYGEDLAKTLSKTQTRLVVLSGCLTSGSTSRVSAPLREQTSCAVVAMQQPIRDITAAIFMPNLYLNLTAGDPLDLAVHKARASICGCHHEWGIPVLTTAKSEAPTTLTEAPTTEVAQTNYGADLRNFVGRKKQQQDLWNMLRDPSVRLVTIFGMGGMGKTSLARRVGLDLQLDFQDGVRLVECDTLEGPGEIISAIARATAIYSYRDLHDLATQLEKKRQLLIVDCFEKCVQHASILQTILLAAPGIKILATSRIILGIDSEFTYELETLAKNKTKGSKFSDRVELFSDAARQSNASFEVTTKNRPIVESLVDLLQGVPLALILAASRLRHFSLEDLHERLQTRLLDDLKHSSKTRDRHASIRIVIQDSFDLLADSEKKLAMQLSVFSGGFTLKDAAAIISDNPTIEEQIGSLYDQSLLASTIQGSEKRFFSLDTVREYLAEAAQSTDLNPVKIRHAIHYADKAKHLKHLFDKGEVAESSAKLWLEIGNLRLAIRTAKELQNQELISDLARSLSRSFLEAGMQTDFALMIKVANETASQNDDLPLKIELRGLEGTLARRKQDYSQAEILWKDRAELCLKLQDTPKAADTYLDLADLYLQWGRLDQTSEMLNCLERLNTSLLPIPILASGLLIKARLALLTTNYPLAITSADQAWDLVSNLPRPNPDLLFVWIGLGRIYRTVGRHEESEFFFRRMLKDSLACHYSHFVGVTLLELTRLYEAKSLPLEASQCLALVSAVARTESKGLQDRVRARSLEMEEVGLLIDHQLGPEKDLTKKWKQKTLEYFASDIYLSTKEGSKRGI